MIIKLCAEHAGLIKLAFGSSPDVMSADYNINLSFSYEDFCDVYLAGRGSFHAYGYMDAEGTITSLISFYESHEEPTWYLTFEFCLPDQDHLKEVMDAVIKHNEDRGRLKFYTKLRAKNRGSHWSIFNDSRYSYIDEYIVPSHGDCFYDYHNKALFFQQLIPGEVIVRCNFLKQEHRDTIPTGGIT
jgi:hypothetical protein